MSTPILKQNLTKGQRVFYFSPIRLTQGNSRGERKVPLTKVIELEFKEIYNGAVCFLKVENGKVTNNGTVLYNSIKGLLFHTEEEATKARDEQYLGANLRVENNLKEYLIEIQERLEKLTISNEILLSKI